jgi:hypothetical protein
MRPAARAMQSLMLDSVSSLRSASRKKLEEQRSVMDEDDDILESNHTNPANDNLARAFRWIGLFCGLAMLAWTAVLLS